MMWLMRLTVQVTADPPGFPVPLHWLTVRGIAVLTWDLGSTVQRALPPPPLAEPLHWVTQAPVAVAVAGNGVQSDPSGLPLPELTHWLTVALLSGGGTAPFCLMLFVTSTLQSIVCAASLSESLHCRTEVTRPAEWVVKVPFGVAHGASVQSRVTVVVELVAWSLIVLTTVTVHLSAVVAPSAPGPWLLHWSTTKLDARVAVGMANPTIENAPVRMSRAITTLCRVCRNGELWVRVVVRVVRVLMRPTL